MTQLPQVTLIALATRDVEATARAMEYSCRDIEFGSIVLLSPHKPVTSLDLQWIHIDPFPSIDNWNEYIVYNLWKHFDTDYCFLVHADGAICNPDKWQDIWLQYDYIGAPWDHETAVAIQGGRDQMYSRVGNSVGLRSRKLCKLPTGIQLEWKRFNADCNEDTFISCHNRKIFEACGMRFASFEVAVEFGRETPLPENENIEPFCFHKWLGHNNKYPRF